MSLKRALCFRANVFACQHAIPLVVLANVLLSWLGVGADGAFSVFAFFFAWSYLRHLYRYPSGALGERAHETQFVKMFPAVRIFAPCPRCEEAVAKA